METYATTLTYAMPIFGFFVLMEAIVAAYLKIEINNTADIISSLCSGMTNALKSLLGLSIVVVSYSWIEESIGIFDIQSKIWTYALAALGVEFASYWAHRFNHRVNVLWNIHIIHHSSEEFNLAVAFRQEMSDILGVYFFSYLPMAIIGIPVEVVAVVAPIHFFIQFWYHTQLIDKMGFLENIIVTPSHHRVHHAINDIYIDKNYGSILILWDKWFGTFQAELEKEKPVFGTLKPVNTWNPIIINFLHLFQLFKDFWNTRSWWDKLKIWFMPTGWRPKDVQDQYPIKKIPVENRKKYAPKLSFGLKAWSWIQFGITNLMMYYMLTQFGSLSIFEIAWYTLYIFISIFGITTLMDVHPLSIFFELIKVGIGFYFIWLNGSWLGFEEWVPNAVVPIQIYFIISICLAVYYVYFDENSSPDAKMVYSSR